MKIITYPDNAFKVPAAKWRNWPPGCRRVFNEMYELMSGNQMLFLHPKDPWRFQEMWNTTAWNAAWEAADAAQRMLKSMLGKKVSDVKN